MKKNQNIEKGERERERKRQTGNRKLTWAKLIPQQQSK